MEIKPNDLGDLIKTKKQYSIQVDKALYNNRIKDKLEFIIQDDKIIIQPKGSSNSENSDYVYLIKKMKEDKLAVDETENSID